MNLTTFKYSLDTRSKKFRCPGCNQNSFVRYIDRETNDYLPEEVGRCDRENNCGYHLTPKQYENDKGTSFGSHSTIVNTTPIEPPKPVDFISLDLMQRSMQDYQLSHFSKYIMDLFCKEKGTALLLKYFVGRSKLHEGKANIFWRIDLNQNVRTGKIMNYNSTTGKRNKDVLPTWVHALKGHNKNPLFPNFNYELCFFGEHLINEFPDKQIAICESEKTAVIASYFMPQFNWLATGGASGCKWREYSVYKVLKNKQVILFPDFGFYNKKSQKTCFQEWQERADVIMGKMNCEIKLSTVLEKSIPESERINDYDLVDMLVKRDANTGIALSDSEYPLIWDL
ncbi:MAG: DUF6371 domain-containing protein [Ginsengibacter sp.]